MEVEFIFGPIDGHRQWVNLKTMPETVEVWLKGCGASGFRTCIYEYCDQMKAFFYIDSFEESMGEQNRLEFVPKDFCRLEGPKNEGGGKWAYWKQLTEE